MVIFFKFKGDVHLLHNQQEIEHQFRGSEGIDSPHNAAVRSFLCLELGKENNDHGKATIMRAVSRYYETKRQQYLDSLPDRRNLARKRQAEKKLTSRRRRLFIKRMKVASGSEKQALQQLDPSFMSDEEDNEDMAGTWIVRSPAWRSPQLSSMLEKLQSKIDIQPSSHPKNNRVQGTPCTRPEPPSSPAWAVCAGDRDRTPLAQRSLFPQPTTPPHPQPSQSLSESSGDENDENLDSLSPESPVRNFTCRHRRRIRALQD